MKKWQGIILATIIMWTGAWHPAHADTSFVAGDGNSLVYGRSILKCDISDGTGDHKNIQCLLLGTVAGKCVVTPVEQNILITENILYMVDIIDSQTARASSLVSNRIIVKFNGTIETLRNIVWNNGLSPHGRLLELPHPDDPDNQSVLILCNASNIVYMFSLNETTDPNTRVRKLQANEIERETTKERYINLDLIDLNTYIANKDKKGTIPQAIAVWYQRETMLWDNRNFRVQANSLALGHLNNIQDGIELYQRLEDVNPFKGLNQAPDVWALPVLHEWIHAPSIVGGAFLNPDANGGINYWFAINHLDICKYKDAADWFKRKIFTYYHLETFVCELQYQQATGRIEFKTPAGKNMFSWYDKETEWNNADNWINYYMRDWTGPRFRKDDIDNLYIDNYCQPANVDEGPWWDTASTSIGKLEERSGSWKEAVGISEFDDKSDQELTEMEKQEKKMVQAGAQVTAVMYGWPYFGVKGTPSSTNTPYISRTESEQHIYWEKSANGGGFEAEVGRQFKSALFGKVGVSAVGGYEGYKGTGKTDESTKSVSVSASYHDTTIDDFSKWGIVIFNTVKPTVLKYGVFKPITGNTITVDGLDTAYWFEFPVITLSFSDNVDMHYIRFDMTRPDYGMPEPTNPDNNALPSPLSKGLSPRDTNTVRPDIKDRNTDIDRILEWERKNKIKEFIRLATHSTYAKTAGIEVLDNKAYYLSNDKELNFSKSHSDEKSTEESWYSGIHFTMEPLISSANVGDPGFPWPNMAELTLTYKGYRETCDTTKVGFAYTVKHNGIPDPRFQPVCFRFYAIDVNIAKLQNFIYSNHEYFTERPAVIPEWNWKYHQNFMLVLTVYESTMGANELMVPVLNSTNAQETYIRIQANENANSAPVLDRFEQILEQNGLPADFYRPLGLFSFETTHIAMGEKQTYVMYVDGDLPINGIWVKTASGEWVNIATSITREGDKLRIEFTIEDGGPCDEDGTANGQILFRGGIGWMAPIGAGSERGFDLNFDGKSDLALENRSNGYIQFNFMDGLKVNSSEYPAVLSDGWHIAGFGRYHDYSAMLLRSDVETPVFLSFITGTDNDADVQLGELPQTWKLLHLADLNGDGDWDIVMENGETSEVYAVYLDLTCGIKGIQLLGKLAPDQVISFPADLSGNGKADLVISNMKTGEILRANIDDDGWHQTPIQSIPSALELLDRGFFNRDNFADLLFRNRETGALYAYFMYGAEVQGAAYLGIVPAKDWRFVKTSDTNGDGLSDTLWVQESTQKLCVGLMQPERFGEIGLLFELKPDWEVK